jgi:DNA-binding PadR family transcriptional regulator
MAPVLGKKEEPDPWTVEEEIPILSKPSGGIKAKIELVKMNLQGPILENPRILYQIGVKIEKNGIVGDLENKLSVFIAGTTKDYEKNDRLCILITAESGVGKTQLLKVLELYFGEDTHVFSRISAHAPDYWQKTLKNGTLDGEILIIKQMEGTEESNYSMMIMADPISGGLRFLTVSKDRKVEELAVPGMPVIGTSSVKLQVDPQVFRRFLDIHPDESPEQTLRIMKHEARLKCDALYRRDCETVDGDLKDVASKMKYESSKFGVEIPFSMLIPDKLPAVILARTDIKKVFGQIVAITHLFYKQRLRYVNPVGYEVLISSPADYYYAYRLLEKALSKRLSGISDDRISVLLNTLKAIDPDKTGVGVEKIQQNVSSYAKNTIYQGLRELKNQGFVMTEDDPQDGRKRVYKRTDKQMTTIAINFPDEEIEKEYIKFVKERLGKDDVESDRKHVLPANLTDLLKKSLLVFDMASGKNLTKEIISQKTFEEYKLGEVSV